MKLTCDGCKHYRGDGHCNAYEFLTYCHDCIRYQAKDKWEPPEPMTLEELLRRFGRNKNSGEPRTDENT